MNKNKKRMAKGIAAAALIGVIAVGSTLAYLSSVTETKTNKFTGAGNIDATIDETNWKEDVEYLPGEVKAKNPQITNSLDSSTPIYTGVKIEFTDKDGKPISYADFQENYGKLQIADLKDSEGKIISWKDGINTSAWTMADDKYGDKGIFVYYSANNGILGKGAETDPAVFDGLKVNGAIKKVITSTTTEVYPAITDPDTGKLVADKTNGALKTGTAIDQYQVVVDENGNIVEDATGLPEFNVNVTGYGVQATDSTKDNYKDELLYLAGLEQRPTE